jgi:hypothetical protein
MRIIDQHMQVWAAAVEDHERNLRNATPHREAIHRAKLQAARTVLSALVAHDLLTKLDPKGEFE